MSELNTLENLFKNMLKDMYYTENKSTDALPKMAKKASNDNLQAALEEAA